MGVIKNYRVVTKTPFEEFKSQPHSMFYAMRIFLNFIKHYGALNEYDKGSFVQTRNPLNGDVLYKKYSVIINVPHTVFEIKKLDKGSIDTEMFMATLKNIKEQYYDEGI